MEFTIQVHLLRWEPDEGNGEVWVELAMHGNYGNDRQLRMRQSGIEGPGEMWGWCAERGWRNLRLSVSRNHSCAVIRRQAVQDKALSRAALVRKAELVITARR